MGGREVRLRMGARAHFGPRMALKWMGIVGEWRPKQDEKRDEMELKPKQGRAICEGMTSSLRQDGCALIEDGK